MKLLLNIIFWLIFIAIAFFLFYALYKNSQISKQRIDKKHKTESLQTVLKNLNANYGDKIFIQIFKKEKILEVWIKPSKSKHYKLLKMYPICYFSGTLGPKLKEGDHQAPEGFYKVYKSSLNPNSKYHLSFNLGYPNEYDKAYNRTGSYLMVHGKCSSVGCYAMGDKNIEEIYKLVKSHLYKWNGYVLVAIYPFKFTKENLLKYRTNRWYSFWMNLKEGYDYFKNYKMPPKIEVKDRKYVIIN